MLPAAFHGLVVACVLLDLLYLSAFTANQVGKFWVLRCKEWFLFFDLFIFTFNLI